MKRKISYTTIIIVSLVILIDRAADFLLKPNRITPEEECEYLLQTEWHQIDDYARFIPYDDDAGCWAVAIAQICHFHNLSPSGKIKYKTSQEKPVSVELDSYKFRHNLFAPRLGKNSSPISIEQVAKYIFFVAAILYTDFGAHSYLKHETFVSRLEHHMKCEVNFFEYDKDTFLRNRDNLTSLVKGEINASRPLMFYFDNGDNWGHAAVLDGYIISNGAFLVHLNMGWGGRFDGWYDLFHPVMGIRDDLQNRFLITIKPNNKNIEENAAPHSSD